MGNPENVKHFLEAVKDNVENSKGWIGLLMSIREGNEIKGSAIQQGNGPVSIPELIALTLAYLEHSTELLKKLWLGKIEFESDRHETD